MKEKIINAVKWLRGKPFFDKVIIFGILTLILTGVFYEAKLLSYSGYMPDPDGGYWVDVYNTTGYIIYFIIILVLIYATFGNNEDKTEDDDKPQGDS